MAKKRERLLNDKIDVTKFMTDSLRIIQLNDKGGENEISHIRF